jgi:hypothetical protein
MNTFPHVACNIIGTRMTGRSGVPIVLLITLSFEDSIKATSWRSPNSKYLSYHKRKKGVKTSSSTLLLNKVPSHAHKVGWLRCDIDFQLIYGYRVLENRMLLACDYERQLKMHSTYVCASLPELES